MFPKMNAGSSTARPGSASLYIGYGEEKKGYRLYDPDKRRICVSQDASFNESDGGIELDVTPLGGDHYVKLELLDESV